MKIFRFAAIAATALVLSATSFAGSAFAQAREKCTIANSHYTGWEPLWLAKDMGILKKWGDKYNVTLDVTDPMDYGESITQFAAGQFCALAVTNMDALTGPAAGGIDTVFEVVGDSSNDNDGVLWKSGKPVFLKDIVGKKVVLVENTVSHYLLWRAAQIAGFDFAKVKVDGAASETDVKNAFKNEGSIIVTWNPILMTARQEKGAQMLFGSAKIPGEIIDGIAVNNEKSSKNYASENARKAIVGAWFEVINIIAQKGTPEYKKAIASMAKGVEQTEAEFESQLRTTALFYVPKDAVAFAKDSKLKDTMDKVRTFSAELELLGKRNNKDFVGIQFPDGSVVGDAKNIKLRFDTKYMQMAADGTL